MHRKSVTAKTKKRKSVKKQKGYGAVFPRSLVLPNFNTKPEKSKVVDYSRPTQKGKGCACSYTGLPQMGKGSYISRSAPSMMIPYQLGKGKKIRRKSQKGKGFPGISTATLGTSQLGKGKRKSQRGKGLRMSGIGASSLGTSQLGKGENKTRVGGKEATMLDETPEEIEIRDDNESNKNLKKKRGTPKTLHGIIIDKTIYSDDYSVRKANQERLKKFMTTPVGKLVIQATNRNEVKKNLKNKEELKKFINSEEISEKLTKISISVKNFKVLSLGGIDISKDDVQNFPKGFDLFYDTMSQLKSIYPEQYSLFAPEMSEPRNLTLLVNEIFKGERAEFFNKIKYNKYFDE